VVPVGPGHVSRPLVSELIMAGTILS
jgi:hypothetical protein